MGRWFRDHDVAPSAAARILTDGDLPAAAQVCALDPVGSVLAANHVTDALRYGLHAAGGELWGYPHTGPLTAVCWAGANLVPVVPVPDAEAVQAFARLAEHRGRRSSSIVGPVDVVLPLWDGLKDSWPAPREIRGDQLSMALRSAPLVDADPAVRVAAPDTFSSVLPASVAMFTEEVGYSPIIAGGAAYAARVRSLIDQGRTYVHIENVPTIHGIPVRKVVFKADLGAMTDAVAQVQGVWVDPAYRGTGRSETGMAAVVEQTLRRVPCVSLYVNGYNTRAVAAYKRVGFEQVGTYATVLF